VHLVSVQVDLFVDVVQFAVYPHADEAGLADVIEHPLMVALAVLDQRRQNHDAAPLRQGKHAIHNLLRRLLGNHTPTVGAMWHANARVQQPEIVINLGDSADCGARVVTGAFLIDGDGWTQALDLIDVWLLHLAQELAGVGRQALDVPPLSLSIDCVERQTRFAGPRYPGDHHKLVARNLDVDILKIVFSCAPHNEFSLGHESLSSPVICLSTHAAAAGWPQEGGFRL